MTNSRRPHPGQNWKHGWIPLTPGAAREKNHGRPLKPGSSAAPRPDQRPSPTGKGREKPQSKPAAKPAARKTSGSRPGARPSGGVPPTGKDTKGKTAAPTAAPTKGKEFIDSHYGEWKNNLSPAQEKAMRFYQSPGFALMNGQLRGLDPKDIKADVSFNEADLARARKASKDLASAIRKAPPLEEPMTVYRGFSADQFGDLSPGMELKDKAFVSTSLTPDVAAVGRATRPATAEIVLPKGAKAAAGSSRELVLPPGSKFRVVETSTRKGIPHVKLELVI